MLMNRIGWLPSSALAILLTDLSLDWSLKYLIPQALHSLKGVKNALERVGILIRVLTYVLGPIGPFLHSGASVVPHCVHGRWSLIEI